MKIRKNCHSIIKENFGFSESLFSESTQHPWSCHRFQNLPNQVFVFMCLMCKCNKKFQKQVSQIANEKLPIVFLSGSFKPPETDELPNLKLKEGTLAISQR